MRTLAVLCGLVLSTIFDGRAQDYLYATGSPTYSTSLPIDHGIVNVNNGDIHLEIPVATKTQRGDLALAERLIYDSRVWKVIQSGSSYSWQPTNVPNSSGGWTFSSGTAANSLSYATWRGQYQTPSPCSQANSAQSQPDYTPPMVTVNFTQYFNWAWTDPSGTLHFFPNPLTVANSSCASIEPDVASGSGQATDGSGYTISISNYTQAVITDTQGKSYVPSSTKVTDRNGNFWSVDGSGNLIDTAGQTPVLASTNGNQTYYDVLAVGGGRQRYTVTYTTVSFNTAFNESDVTEASGSFSAIQSIGLPDGSSYQFSYDSGTSAGHYGELTSMTLPTGGVIAYGYTNYLDSYNNQNRWLSSIVRDGGTTTFTPTLISKCSSSVGCQESVDVRSPASNDTVYTFTLDKTGQAAGKSWIASVNTYQGTASSGSLLRSAATTYAYTTAGVGWYEGATYTNESYAVPSGITGYVKLSDIGYTAETQTTLWQATPLPAETKNWDFSNQTGNAPTTDTVYSYAAYGLPTSTVVKDGSGNQVSSTTYGYDENSPAASSNVPNHGSPLASQRGNLTSSHAWINTNGQTLTTSMTYDDAGALLTSSPPEGKTSYGYDATDTFVTSTTLPTPSSGVVLTTTRGYDASTGAVTSTTDANNQSVTYKTFDTFNRAQEVDKPDGGITKISYASTSASVSASNSSTGWTIKATDVYGRPSRANEATGVSSNPWYMQDTCYNNVGQLSFQSYRFQGQFSQAAVCSGAGDAYLYDALSRITQVTHGDGSAVHYGYKGRAIQTTDENGVSRIVQTDAFGRTTIVCEISSNSTMPGSGSPAACGTDIAGTGFVTSYSYDVANHKTTITQGSQTRTFQVDSLGRNILTQEPESGSTTYSYAYNSTGLVVTRQKPQANQTNTSTLTTTTTQYDAADRVVSITYNDGTPAKYFAYDTQGGWAQAQANVKGRLEKASSSIAGNLAATIYSYDPSGRVAFTGQCQPSGCFNAAKDKYTPYTWDYAGDLLSGGDGAGTTISYSYTPAGETTGISSSQSDATHPGTLLGTVANGPNGPLSFKYGNGLYGVHQYDSLGRLDNGSICSGSSAAGCSGGSQLYGYSMIASGGRFTQVCDTVNNSCTNLSYDDLNRMVGQKTIQGSTTTNSSWTYDRYGNRWSQQTTHGANPSVSFNTANNQEVGFSYDAAGNMTSDGIHQYSYDAEGNVLKVDGGSTATYYYDALNQRVRSVVNGTAYEFVFNLSGQRVSVWNGTSGALLEENTYWGSLPLDLNLNNALHFEHQDWMGTERLNTSYNGTVEGTYASLPFGDSLSSSGSDEDPYHFAMLDHDYESGLEHASYRNYSSVQAHWMSPDPYTGSYDASNPQSFNRYSYVLNNPLSAADPSGKIGEATAAGCLAGPEGCVVGVLVDVGEAVVGGAVIDGIIDGIKDLFGLFSGPSFHGSLKPRPNAQPWDEYNIHYGPNIAGALGLPDETCEFGACSGGTSSFGPGGSVGAAGTLNIGWLQPVLDFDVWFLRQTTPAHGPPWHGHWCGLGGAGEPTDGHDSNCMRHDYCYFRNGLNAGDNLDDLPTARRKALQGCNQTLCDAESKLGGFTADMINSYFYIAPNGGNACR